nr:hypothetical protein [Tanacetum cinerariifolium]
MDVDPLNKTHLEDLGLNTCNHDIPLSFREVPSFDELEPQLKPLPTILRFSTASPQVSTANLSDATVYDFLANQPNGSQLVHEDLKQIHEDDLEEMDLKWQLALLSMRAKRFFQKNGKKITINGSDIAGYDKSKVECFNCHNMRHFARECRVPRNQENKTRNQETTRRTVNVEDTSSKGMVEIDGASFDWSYMADDKAPTNMAFMALSDSEERECKIYDAFDKFAYQKGETLRDFYLRFSLLLNDMNMYNMKLEQFQVNTKFLNTLPPEWKFSSPENGLVVPVFQKGDDPIDAINHMMSFLTSVVTYRYPATNNQL